MRVLKYFLVGGAAASVDFLLFGILIKVCDLPWMIAGSMAFIASTITNYFLSIAYVFKSGNRFQGYQEKILVFGVSAVGLLINQLVLGFFINHIALNIFIAKILGTGVVFFWNFGARNYFIFREVC